MAHSIYVARGEGRDCPLYFVERGRNTDNPLEFCLEGCRNSIFFSPENIGGGGE